MQIYSDGKNRVIKGNFPKRFKLLNAGAEVPYLRTAADTIRLSGELPIGALDIEEVIAKKTAQPAKLDATSLAIINKQDFDRIDILNKKLAINQEQMNAHLSALTEHEATLANLETQNAQAIEDTNENIVEMAKVIGKEIQADRESIKQASASLSSSLRETGDILSSKIEAHEKAKNPHNLTKATIGLERVDNTSDEDKPISKKTQNALDKKADKSEVIELEKKIDATGKQQEKFVKTLDRINWTGGVGGNEIPTGGKEGQLLGKASNKDGDYKWVDPESGIEIIRVDELPETGETNTLYLVPVDDPETSNIYDEYIWAVQSDDTYGWEKIGSTEIDLSGYVPYTGATQTVDLNAQDLKNIDNLAVGTATVDSNEKILSVGQNRIVTNNNNGLFISSTTGQTRKGMYDVPMALEIQFNSNNQAYSYPLGFHDMNSNGMGGQFLFTSFSENIGAATAGDVMVENDKGGLIFNAGSAKSGSKMRFTVGSWTSTPQITVTANSVGIKNLNPDSSYALDVNGTINASTDVKINGSSVALVSQIPTDNSDLTNGAGYQTSSDVASAISVETTNRENADIGLQQQIDAITASSDVKDIVGTYAQLQAYDTSTLGNNDIIKVLQDETHSNETTYYRWSTTTETFTLIGEEGPYYTKSEADSTFVPKTRTVNNKALSSNITLTASDVGALPDSTVIPTVNNATLKIQKNGTDVATFTANSSTNATANITVPTDTGDLTNGAGFITGITSSDVTSALGYTPVQYAMVIEDYTA